MKTNARTHKKLYPHTHTHRSEAKRIEQKERTEKKTRQTHAKEVWQMQRTEECVQG